MYETLFTVANVGVMPAWLLLAVAPDHPFTVRAVRSGAWSLVYCVLYAALLVKTFMGPMSSDAFETLASIQHAFSMPVVALLGWVHYIAFDLLVGVRVAEEGKAAGFSRLALAPFLFFTLMFGPVGFLGFRVARFVKTRS